MSKDYQRIYAEMGERLRIVRQRSKYNRKQLAALSGVSRNQIMRIEQGRVSPTLTTVDKLCMVLKYPLKDLLAVFSDSRFQKNTVGKEAGEAGTQLRKQGNVKVNEQDTSKERNF